MNERLLGSISSKRHPCCRYSFSLLCIVLACMFLLSACLCEQEPEPRWTSHRSSAFNMGWLPAGTSFQNAPAWQVATSGPIWATPVFGQDGTLYFGSCDGHVYALDPAKGTGKYAPYLTGGCILGLVVTDKAVYATSADHNLYAFDLSLNPQWKFPAGGAATSAPMLFGSTLFFAADDKKLYAVDLNGKGLWAVATGDIVSSTPAVSVTTGAHGARPLVIFGCSDHNVYALDQETGEQVWKFPGGDQTFYAPPAIDAANGRVLIGSVPAVGYGDGRMYSLDANTGNEIWEFDPGVDQVSRAAVVEAGNVYFATDGGKFYGLDKNKNPLPPWTKNGMLDPAVLEFPAGAPVLNLSNGQFFIWGYDTLFLMDPNNRSRTPLLSANSFFIADPAFGPNGLVVVGGNDGTLYAFH